MLLKTIKKKQVKIGGNIMDSERMKWHNNLLILGCESLIDEIKKYEDNVKEDN